MRFFEDESYYQILQISTNASDDEIKRAYRDALAIYQEDSVVTYSLFSEEQRDAVLRDIETAFGTLINEKKRAAYNQMLIDSGRVDADVFSQKSKRMLAVRSDSDTTSKEKSLHLWIEKKVDDPEIKKLSEQIHANALFSGPQFKQLREAYGIDISEIYAITKINSDILKKIEANRFSELPAAIYLKQFIHTYAEILHLDPRHAVESYLKCMALDKSQS